MIGIIHYPSDTRVRREIDTLRSYGVEVDVICVRKEGQSRKEYVEGAQVYRMNLRRKRGSLLRYLWENLYFFIVAAFRLSLGSISKRYDVVHVHNMPDHIVFCALLPRLLGSKIILDLHDPTPEVFMTKYKVGEKHPAIRLLTMIEKLSIRFATHVLTPNIAFRNLFIKRDCPPSKISIVMNSPLERLFITTPVEAEPNMDTFRVMYHGSIVKRHGLDLALKALVLLRDKIPNLTFDVFGHGEYVEPFLEMVDELQLHDVVKYHGFVFHDHIPPAINKIDVGIIPNRKSPFTDLNFPVRIFEYLALKKPVIVPDTMGIRDYFKEEEINFFVPGDVESLSNAILNVYQQPAHQKTILDRSLAVYSQHRWSEQGKRLAGIVHSLAGRPLVKTDSGKDDTSSDGTSSSSEKLSPPLISTR